MIDHWIEPIQQEHEGMLKQMINGQGKEIEKLIINSNHSMAKDIIVMKHEQDWKQQVHLRLPVINDEHKKLNDAVPSKVPI